MRERKMTKRVMVENEASIELYQEDAGK